MHDLAISLDGYAAGPDQSLDLPLGVGGERLHEWTVTTRSFRRIDGTEHGDDGLDDDFIDAGDAGIGEQYLRAGLIDDMHVAIVPILLGGGERLFDHLDGGPHGYECVELVSSPSVAHARIRRATR